MLVHVVPPVVIVVATLALAVGLRRLTNSGAVREKVPAEILETATDCRGPLVALVLVVMLRAYQPIFESRLHVGTRGTLLNVALLVILGWLAVRVAQVLIAIVQLRLSHRFADDQERIRRIQTQLTVFRAVVSALIWLATLIFILLSFPATRPIATSLFASATLLSLVVGIAAQGTLGSMFAGLQIAFGDIVRIGDMVVIDGQRGQVEEIALTYVVVRLLDYRRLVVPVTHFTTKPFENWTRKHPGVKAETHMNVDLAAPVATIRAKVAEIIEKSPWWDRDEWSLVIAEPEPDAHLLRLKITATGETPAAASELCAQLREQVQEYLVGELPEALPRVRHVSVARSQYVKPVE